MFVRLKVRYHEDSLCEIWSSPPRPWFVWEPLALESTQLGSHSGPVSLVRDARKAELSRITQDSIV